MATIADCEGLQTARAVWDFTTGDMRRFQDRVNMMLHAMNAMRGQGIAAEFVALLHGPATKFGTREFAGTKFAHDDASLLPAIHALLQRFIGDGGRVEICRIAMDRCLVSEDNVLPGLVIEENVFTNSIALQNRGYAYVPVS
jgi:intracellular sulfur oxidation DsrE/DsrF family protein